MACHIVFVREYLPTPLAWIGFSLFMLYPHMMTQTTLIFKTLCTADNFNVDRIMVNKKMD